MQVTLGTLNQMAVDVGLAVKYDFTERRFYTATLGEANGKLSWELSYNPHDLFGEVLAKHFEKRLSNREFENLTIGTGQSLLAAPVDPVEDAEVVEEVNDEND